MPSLVIVVLAVLVLSCGQTESQKQMIARLNVTTVGVSEECNWPTQVHLENDR